MEKGRYGMYSMRIHFTFEIENAITEVMSGFEDFSLSDWWNPS